MAKPTRTPSRSLTRRPRPQAASPALFESLEQRRYLSVAVPTGGAGLAPSAGTPSPTTVATATSPSVEKPLTVYSWQDWGIEGVTPLAWVEMHGRSPRQAADETIPLLEAQPVGKRGILLWCLGHQFTDRPIDQIVTDGLNIAHDRAYMTEYFGYLKDAGITPDYVVMDYEGGVSVWQVPMADIQRVMSDPTLRAQLPADLQRYSAADFTGPDYVDAFYAWNAWATDTVLDALRETVRDPARAVFGRDVPMSNWEDRRPSVTTYDLNGWAQKAGGDYTVAGWSSPAAYLGGHGNRFAPYDDANWANFVNNLNTIRSVLGTGEQVAPWVSDSRYGNDPDLWAEMIRQIRASGVDTMLLWNPEQGAYSDAEYAEAKAYTARVFADVLAMPDASHDAVVGLPQLTLDTPVVDTLGFGILHEGRLRSTPVIETVTADDDDELEARPASDDSVPSAPVDVDPVGQRDNASAAPASSAVFAPPSSSSTGVDRLRFLRMSFTGALSGFRERFAAERATSRARMETFEASRRRGGVLSGADRLALFATPTQMIGLRLGLPTVSAADLDELLGAA